jgi:hypothetical protein
VLEQFNDTRIHGKAYDADSGEAGKFGERGFREH